MENRFIPNSTDIFNEPVRSRKLVSVIVPAYNEEGNIAQLEQELNEATDGLPYDFEFVLVDNNSKDQTGQMIKNICRRDPRWKYIKFSRNFRVESSIAAGYKYAQGDAMIVLYSDLQEPPHMIPLFLQKWSEGYDNVYGVHTKRIGDSAIFSSIVKLAYRLVNWCSDTPIPEDTGDFRLISRRVRDALEQCGDYHRYTRGLIAWLGFPQIGVPYERRSRTKGKSNSNIFVYWSYFSNAITSFSMTPLRAFSLLGIIACLTGLIILSLSAWLAYADQSEAFNVFITGLCVFLSGVQFAGIGALGEYVGRTYTEVKNRPLYIVEETANVAESSANYLHRQVDLASR
jgi:glycosyltransferase involved in cell wall biosynthesis